MQLPPPSRWPWAVGLFVLLAVGSVLGVRAFSAWRRRARGAAPRHRAVAARTAPLVPTAGRRTHRRFLRRTIRHRAAYLEDRFELRAPELTTEEFLETVQQAPDLSRDHQVLLREFLRQADLVKFAGMKPAEEDVNRSVTAAKRFLDETRENAAVDRPCPRPSGGGYAGTPARGAVGVQPWVIGNFAIPCF